MYLHSSAVQGCFIVHDRAGAQTHGGLVERRIRSSPVLKQTLDSIKEKGGAIQYVKAARVYKVGSVTQGSYSGHPK